MTFEYFKTELSDLFIKVNTTLTTNIVKAALNLLYADSD